MTLDEFKELVRTFTQDIKPYIDNNWPGSPAALNRDELIEKLIDLNIYELSRYAERREIENISGAGTSLYRLESDLTYWEDNFSFIRRIVYPFDITVENPTPLVFNKDYKIENRLWGTDTAETLVFITSTPTSTETINIEYTILHDFISDPISLSDEHIDYYAYFIAGKYLEVIAAEWLQHIDGTNTSDIVAAGGVSPITDVKALAQNFIANFYNHFGVDPETQTGNASDWQEWDMSKEPRFYWYHK